MRNGRIPEKRDFSLFSVSHAGGVWCHTPAACDTEGLAVNVELCIFGQKDWGSVPHCFPF